MRNGKTPLTAPVLTFFAALMLAIGLSDEARSQQNMFQRLVGQWRDLTTHDTIIITSRGEVFAQGGQISGAVAALTGNEFAFENQQTRCVFNIAFLADGSTDWGLTFEKTPSSCPKGGLFYKIGDDPTKVAIDFRSVFTAAFGEYIPLGMTWFDFDRTFNSEGGKLKETADYFQIDHVFSQNFSQEGGDRYIREVSFDKSMLKVTWIGYNEYSRLASGQCGGTNLQERYFELASGLGLSVYYKDKVFQSGGVDLDTWVSSSYDILIEFSRSQTCTDVIVIGRGHR
jgi:hypothetical protein